MQHRVETSIIHEEQILEAIDQLRRRKARPDADRICNYLLRKFSVDARDTIADLHRLIEAEKVIQVDYKGNTSYRNASKWSRLQLYKNRPEGFVKEKLNSSMLTSAFAELLVEEPDYLDQGVPAYRLIDQLLDGISNPTSRKMVDDFLAKEVSTGNITRMSNGNYSLVGTSDVSSSSASIHLEKEEDNQENSRRYSSETGDSGKDSNAKDNTCEFFEFNESGNCDSRSDTPKSSRQASPKDDINNKIDGFEPIEKEVSGIIEESVQVSIKENEKVEIKKKEEVVVKIEDNAVKRTSKSERKQRLLVRPDDSMDLEIKFEDYDRRDEKERGKRSREPEGEQSEEREDEDTGRSSANQSPTLPGNVGGFRSARRKRAKKVFDPSDNIFPKRKRGRQAIAPKPSLQPVQEFQEVPAKSSGKEGPSRKCSLCSKDKGEALVACRDCTVRAHLSCIWSPDELLQKAGNSWQCERCKSCTVCCETSDIGPLITCIACDEAYHYTCHSPRVPSSRSHSKWHCSNCTEKKPAKPAAQSEKSQVSRPDTPINPPTLPPVLSPQVSPTRGSIEHNDDEIPARDGIDPNIPDASDWTSEQVYQYFARLFPKEAEVFRVQDIDGHSLLLMKRTDVLIGLDLLLGPALKIYRHVLKLQMRRDDTRFYWL